MEQTEQSTTPMRSRKNRIKRNTEASPLKEEHVNIQQSTPMRSRKTPTKRRTRIVEPSTPVEEKENIDTESKTPVRSRKPVTRVRKVAEPSTPPSKVDSEEDESEEESYDSDETDIEEDEPYKLTNDDYLAIHNAIHGTAKSVTINGVKMPVQLSKNKCRCVTFPGQNFMEQNKEKASNFAKMAKNGAEITWIVRRGKWGMIKDGCVVALGEAWGNSSKLVFTNHTDMWLYVALGAVLVYVFLMCYFNKAHRNLIPGHMPVVCGFIPFLGVAISYGPDPLTYVRSLQKKHGTIFQVCLMGQMITMVTNPHDIQKVYTTTKNFDFHEVGNMFGETMFSIPKVVSGPQITHTGFKMLQKDLQGESLHEMSDKTQGKIHDLIEKQSTEWKEVQLYKWLNDTIITISTTSLIGDDSNVQGMLTDFRPFDNSVFLLATKLPRFLLGDAIRKKEKFLSIFDGSKVNDDAAKIMRMRYDLFRGMVDDKGMASLTAAIVFASLTNTINASFWCVYELLRQPAHVRKELYEEIRTIWPEGESIPHFTYQQLTSLPKLDAYMDEVTRTHHNVFSVRACVQDIKFEAQDGHTYTIRKGDFLNLVSSHDDREIFPEPENLIWDRFVNKDDWNLEKFGEPIRLNSAFIPWGGGTSLCPGRHFAKVQIRMYIAIFLCAFDIEKVGNDNVKLDIMKRTQIVAPPVGDITVRFRKK